MCIPKSFGGLGLRRIINMNKVFLTELGWCTSNKENELWVKFLTAKYLRGRSFWSVQVSKEAS